MTAYLVANPPRRSQYRKPRRASLTGTIVLHSAENVPDLRPPDEGAEKIAQFIRDRSDAGSYHKIADQDTRIQLVPFEWEAFGDGTGSNPWAIHLSLALRAEDWSKLTDQQRLWYMAGLATCAREASDWLRVNRRIVVPVRRLTKASQREAGFCSHMDRESWEGKPGRRTDPWRNDEGMWHLFLSLYADAVGSQPPDAQEDDEMAAIDPNYRGQARTQMRTFLGRSPKSYDELDFHADEIKRLGLNGYIEWLEQQDEAKAWAAKIGAEVRTPDSA